MIRVFSSPLITQAHIVRGALGVEGVRAEVRGEARTSLAGGIPIEASMAEVWIDPRDLDVAKSVIARLLPGGGSEGSLSLVPEGGEVGLTGWRCTHCGEISPPEFELCWSCEEDREET